MVIDPSLWREENTYRQWYRPALELLPEKIHNLKILEIGSGLGEFSGLLKKADATNLTCSDLSLGYVKSLKDKGFKAVVVDLNHKLPFKSNTFDLIIGLEVIEHTYNTEYLLKELQRVLKPKGILILSTPNFAWWGYRLRYLRGYPPKVEGYHLRHFTFNSLKSKLSWARLKYKSHNSICTVPYVNRLLIKLGRKPLWPKVRILPNLLAQDLIFKATK